MVAWDGEKGVIFVIKVNNRFGFNCRQGKWLRAFLQKPLFPKIPPSSAHWYSASNRKSNKGNWGTQLKKGRTKTWTHKTDQLSRLLPPWCTLHENFPKGGSSCLRFTVSGKWTPTFPLWEVNKCRRRSLRKFIVQFLVFSSFYDYFFFEP